jgi:hypothetical protein
VRLETACRAPPPLELRRFGHLARNQGSVQLLPDYLIVARMSERVLRNALNLLVVVFVVFSHEISLLPPIMGQFSNGGVIDNSRLLFRKLDCTFEIEIQDRLELPLGEIFWREIRRRSSSE